jgi:hypothetical protein
MTEATISETTETDAEQSQTEQTKPTDTVEFWKAKAREQESRAKANKSAAEELAALKQSQMSEQERLTSQLAEANKAAETARSEALRMRVASKFGIGDEDADLFLTATDEATLTKQAERLTAREADRKKQGNHVPREGESPGSAKNDPMRDVTRRLFKRDD